MPRTYKPSRERNYKKYNDLLIEQALTEYNTTDQSLKDIAQKYNISKSVLHRHNTFFMKKQGGQAALAPEEEEYLIQYINVCSEWGYPLETIDFRFLIKGYLDKLGVTIPRFKDNMPGPDYIKSFLNRNKSKVTSRLSQNIKRSRAAVSPESIREYFDELEVSLQGIPLSNIINYDETNLVDDPGRKRVIVKRSVKYPERIMNHTKGSTSIMIAASANGNLLPPYVVYKAQHVYDTWRQNGLKGCRYNCTSSGWFDGVTFEDWVSTIVFKYFEDKTGTKILIGDNLSSHLSIELINECQKRNIRFIFLPANSTHLTQPLDVAFFRPLKIAWRHILFNWKKTDGRMQASIPKNIFPLLFKKLMNQIESNEEKNILAGFEKCGISPMNKNKVLDRLPNINEEAKNENFKYAIDQTVLSILKEMTYGTGCHKISNKKKKLVVIPGRSVENIMSEESEDLDETKELSNDESNTEEIENNDNFKSLDEPGPSKRYIEKITNTKNKKVVSQTSIIQKAKGKKTDNPSLVKKTKIKREKDMKQDNLTDISTHITKINEPNITEKSELTFKKPFSPKVNNNNELVDCTIEQNDYSMEFHHDFVDLDINAFPVVLDDFFTVNGEVELSSSTTAENKIEVQANKENTNIRKSQIEKKSEFSDKRIKVISEEIITSRKPIIKINKLNKIKLTDSIVFQKPKFYKNDTEILHDLMDENII